MIKQKIIFNKKGIATKMLITIIIAVFVIAAVAMFLFKVDINSYLRNLPGYSVPENDTEINMSELSDEEIKDLCPVIVGKINVPEGGIAGIGSKQYIFVNNQKTNLYWIGNKREGVIKISEKDIKVAEIKGGIVSLNSDFFNSDKSFITYSESYQKIRFDLNIDIEDFVKIHNSFYAGNNLLCNYEKSNITIDRGLLGDLIVLDTELLKLERVKRGIFGIDNGLKINFSPYITLPEESKFNFLYVQDRKKYLEIKGAVTFWPDAGNLGRIYSDGSIWINKGELNKGAIIENVSTIFSEVYKPYYESNLRVNYDEVKQILNEK